MGENGRGNKQYGEAIRKLIQPSFVVNESFQSTYHIGAANILLDFHPSPPVNGKAANCDEREGEGAHRQGGGEGEGKEGGRERGKEGGREGRG